MRELLSEDAVVATWGLSRVEVVSAVERANRAGRVDAKTRRALLDRFGRLGENWHEVTDLLAVRKRAMSLLARYPLRTGDAAQLAAALLLAEDDPATIAFVCLDRRLADAATREGFRVLGVV